ncbi:MAG TPA: hypothetical protein VJJ98_05230 [Sedimentisphaerales bacterium]|nr:hypothetical protein [Sedimentisphaerales bacterium]
METTLSDWITKFGPSTSKEFMKRARSYVFRISWLLDHLLLRHLQPPVVRMNGGLRSVDEPMPWIQHNTLLSLIGALTCFKNGLFVQSGVLLRSVMENCFVLVDISQNKGQFDRLLQDRYSVSGVVARTKSLVPPSLVGWYGYFSRNFAHFGPAHPAPIMPWKCWPDNWIFVTGLQNLLRGCVAFGLVLERIDFEHSPAPVFWKRDPKTKLLVFNEEAPVWKWIEDLGKEVMEQYPPKERKNGIIYSDREYKLK